MRLGVASVLAIILITVSLTTIVLSHMGSDVPLAIGQIVMVALLLALVAVLAKEVFGSERDRGGGPGG